MKLVIIEVETDGNAPIYGFHDKFADEMFLIAKQAGNPFQAKVRFLRTYVRKVIGGRHDIASDDYYGYSDTRRFSVIAVAIPSGVPESVAWETSNRVLTQMELRNDQFESRYICSYELSLRV